MASMNFCPYPVDPWKLIMMTTYPLLVDEVGAANNSGFQRYDQSSPQAPCGPPWMRNFTGYFLLASKLGGLTMNPWPLVWAAPVNQKVCAPFISIVPKTGSFMEVRKDGRRSLIVP